VSIEDEAFGEWSIDESLYEFIRETLYEGSVILELGSGYGTSRLAKHYNMISVESDLDFVGKYDSWYIHAPMKEHKALANHDGTLWYDVDILRPKLKGLEYDLLLVDGPPKWRAGFLKYKAMFNLDTFMIFDDFERDIERKVVNSIASHLGCSYAVRGNGEGKPFAVFNDPLCKL
jgi:hypothetical protein